MKEEQSQPRVVGLDMHPDIFTAAILSGKDPASAQVEKIADQGEQRSPRVVDETSPQTL